MTSRKAATALPNAATTSRQETADMTTTTTPVDQAISFIARTGHVTFVELQRFAETTLGMDARGDYAIEAVPNLILWAGCSEAFIELVRAIQATRRVDVNPTTPLTYMIDGQMLTFPIAKRPPKNGYKDPHWVPTVLHLKPATSKETR